MDRVAETNKAQKFPTFTKIDEFCSFVQSLSNKEIQSWSTAEWVELYKNIDSLRYSNSLSLDDFVYDICEHEIKKLYKNYRMDKDVLEKTSSLAKEFGEYLAQKDKVHLANLFHMSDSEAQDQLQNISDSLAKIGFMDGKISVHLDKLKWFNNGNYSPALNAITISSSFGKDVIDTIAHELAHGGLQSGTNRRNNLFSKDFYSLCDYNECFYYTRRNYNKPKSLKSKVQRLFRKKAFSYEAYYSQPLESQAFWFGYLCRRAYQENLKPRERTAVNVVKWIGQPEKISYLENEVIFEYSPQQKNTLKRLIKVLPEHASVSVAENKNLLLSLKSDYTSNRILFALSYASLFCPAWVKYTLNWIARDNKKASLYVKKFLTKHAKTILAIGMFMTGMGIGFGGAALTKTIKENKQNKALNQEWIAAHADADSVFADAKTAHFYALKNMPEAEKDEYMKQIDALEKKYLELAQDENLLRAVAGNLEMEPTDDIIYYYNSVPEKERIKWYKLSDGTYIEDSRTARVSARINILRERINRGIEQEIVADQNVGTVTSDAFFVNNNKDPYLDEMVSSVSINKHNANIKGFRVKISLRSDNTSDNVEKKRIPGTTCAGLTGEQYKKIMEQKIADKKQKD